MRGPMNRGLGILLLLGSALLAGCAVPTAPVERAQTPTEQAPEDSTEPASEDSTERPPEDPPEPPRPRFRVIRRYGRR